MGGEVFRVTLTNTPGNYVLVRDTVAEDLEGRSSPTAGVPPPRDVPRPRPGPVHAGLLAFENEGDGAPQMPSRWSCATSLFDGCFSGFAERPPGVGGDVQNGSGPFVADGRRLAHVRPATTSRAAVLLEQAGPHRPVPARGAARVYVFQVAFGIWKWGRAAAAHVSIRNTVFRLDMPSYSTCASQKWPAGTYRNVWLVWAGAGPYSTAGGCTNQLPAGVTLTNDARVWDKAKAAWMAGKSPVSPLPTPGSATRVSARAVGPGSWARSRRRPGTGFPAPTSCCSDAASARPRGPTPPGRAPTRTASCGRS